jgi:hypothetical protein
MVFLSGILLHEKQQDKYPAPLFAAIFYRIGDFFPGKSVSRKV